MNIFKKMIKLICMFVIALGAIALSISFYMVNYSRKYIVEIDDIDKSNYEYILILGAGYRSNFQPSPMLKDRLDCGIKVFYEMDDSKILLSGDSMNPEDHDEIRVMKNYCVDNGIGRNNIVEDKYGLSTYESMWRCKNVYNGSSAVIITQKYHLYRAIYIARKLGIDAVGVACDNQDYGAKMIWYTLREILARNKDFIWCIRQMKATYID